MAIVGVTDFGTLLRRYRLAAGLTQEELAERARLSVRAITDLERGARWVPQWRRAIEGRSPLHQHLASIPAVRVPCHRSL
jgi:DNA-binding XRE family transcriptional regulator